MPTNPSDRNSPEKQARQTRDDVAERTFASPAVKPFKDHRILQGLVVPRVYRVWWSPNRIRIVVVIEQIIAASSYRRARRPIG